VAATACTPWRSPPAASETPARAATSLLTASPIAVASPVTIDAGAPIERAARVDSQNVKAIATAPDGMLFVPGGTFMMGSDAGGQDDEHPAHRVTLRAFFLDRTEVTNGAYAACVAAGKCRASEPASSRQNHFGPDAAFRGAEQPVSSISWDDARAYCVFVGKRLPTEAEFERAARGDDERRYPWGNDAPSPERAVFAASRTANVGTHPAGAGPYGHLDLAGNVWEWIEDFYDPDAYRRAGADHGVPGTCEQILATQDALRHSGRQGFTGTNPIPTECEHVLRGGAFNYGGDGLRSSNRVHHPGRFRLIMSGVRCAKDAE
jgi:formylglycine-generating enzyme required for sulfatase activity